MGYSKTLRNFKMFPHLSLKIIFTNLRNYNIHLIKTMHLQKVVYAKKLCLAFDSSDNFDVYYQHLTKGFTKISLYCFFFNVLYFFRSKLSEKNMQNCTFNISQKYLIYP